MIDPIQLAQQSRAQSRAIAIQRRVAEQKRQESGATETGFWDRFDSVQGVHYVRLMKGGEVPAISGVPTGFQENQTLTVAITKGEPVARIRVRR